jgi:hypothetical protein
MRRSLWAVYTLLRLRNNLGPVRFLRLATHLSENIGATRQDRTGDLLITNQPLYQLS